MKKLIFIVVFFLVSVFSFGQIYHAPVDTAEFCNIDTIHVTSYVRYSHDLTYNMNYEGDGIVTCGKAVEVEPRTKVLVDTIRFNADRTMAYIGTWNGRPWVYKVYEKYNKIVLEQILPIGKKHVIMYDRRYGNREDL